MHALVPAVLLRVAGLDPFNVNSQAQPPDGELAEPIERRRGRERHAVIGADYLGPPTLLERPIECGEGEALLCRGERLTGQQVPGVPPKPGLTSCAGKIEGRYATTGGFGMMTILFRSGKAIMKDGVSDNDTELECWMGGGKLYLLKPGDSAGQDMPLDINDDGTLQSPFGEMKRKGSS